MPTEQGHKSFGVIDIGSNSVRMVIYEVTHVPPVQIFNEKVYCALGRDLSKTSRLNPDGVEAALKTLQAYSLIASAQGLTRLEVVGTAALRDAEDGADFIEQAQKRAGLTIRTISGLEEARYAALGVLSLSPEADGVVADFGGGSLELARVHAGEVGEAVSLPFGAFRIIDMGAAAANTLTEKFREIRDRFSAADTLYAIGGSWRALAQAYLAENGDGEQALHGLSIRADLLRDFCHMLMTLSTEEAMRRFKLEYRRAALLAVSAHVLQATLDGLGMKTMVVSSSGVRDGLLYDFLQKNKLE